MRRRALAISLPGARSLSWLALLLALAIAAPAARGQPSDLIELRLEPSGIGYDGYFRPGFWLPIRASITNHSQVAIQGALTIRPQTSPGAVANAFSAPVYLSADAGSRISLTLYIQPLAEARLLRLELLDEQARVLARQNFRLQLVPSADQLHMVISDSSSTAPLDMSAIHNGGARALQGAWRSEHLPERTAALAGIDQLLISNADTGEFNAAQREALAGWVAAGGHLLVTGGSTAARANRTAAGLGELLPIRLTGQREIADLTLLARFVGAEDNLRASTAISIGEILPGARVLLRHDAAGAAPLILQRDYGDGLVTYLSADPLADPLQRWPGIRELWFTLALSANPRPGWASGWLDWDDATQASEIMPGLNLLPNTVSMVGFLALYIFAVGPLNYALLNILRRREWAWLSIPAFIALFSAGAWALGQHLRGTSVTLNRIAIVRAWPDIERAQADQLLGLLSPRRDRLTLDLPEHALISAPPISEEDDALSLRSDSLLNIEQGAAFRAAAFTSDAGLVRHFVLSGTAAVPAISGEASLSYGSDGREQTLRGTIENRGDFSLEQPALLFRNHHLPLEEPLLPGESREFSLNLPNYYEARDPGGAAAPSRIVDTPNLLDEFSSRGLRRSLSVGDTSGRQLLGRDYSASRSRSQYEETAAWQQALRRRLLLDAAINDHAHAPGRGNRLYLAGWGDAAIDAVQLTGAESSEMAETLYLIALPVRVDYPEQAVRIAAEQFTWHAPYTSMNHIGPHRFTLRPDDDFVFEFIPLPEARLERITAIHFVARLTTSMHQKLEAQIWNWRNAEWELFRIGVGATSEETTIRERVAEYLGPLGRVRLRMTREESGGFLNLNMLGVEFEGHFASMEEGARLDAP